MNGHSEQFFQYQTNMRREDFHDRTGEWPEDVLGQDWEATYMQQQEAEEAQV